MLFCVSLMPEIKCLFHFNLATSHCWYFRHSIPSCFSMDHSPPGSSVPMDFSLPSSSVHGVPQEKYTGVGCYALLQGIFLTKGLNPYLLCLLNWQEGSLPTTITWEAHVCIHRCMYLCVCVCVCIFIPNLSDSLYNSKTLLSYGVCYLNYEHTQDLWK